MELGKMEEARGLGIEITAVARLCMKLIKRQALVGIFCFFMSLFSFSGSSTNITASCLDRWILKPSVGVSLVVFFLPVRVTPHRLTDRPPPLAHPPLATL